MADSPTHPGPRESVPAQRARAAELACDGQHHPNGESEHLTQLRAAVEKTWPVSDRSVRSCHIFGRLSALRIRMTIAYSSNQRWKVCLPQITSDKQNTVSRTKAIIITPALAMSTVAMTGKVPRHCRARVMIRRCETHLDRSLATTSHDTKREVKGGGRRTSGETSGRRSSGRACTRARARGPCEFAGFSSALKQIGCLSSAVCGFCCWPEGIWSLERLFSGRPRTKKACARLCVPPQEQLSRAHSRARA